MGFHRAVQPASLDRAAVTDAVLRFLADEAIVVRDADSFVTDGACPRNPAGHWPLRFQREIVCAHCSKVLWS
jgi:hypothetical protein